MPSEIEFDDWMDDLAEVWRDRYGSTMPNIGSESVWDLYYRCDCTPEEALTRYITSREVVAKA